jgi:hypothetical protein
MTMETSKVISAVVPRIGERADQIFQRNHVMRYHTFTVTVADAEDSTTENARLAVKDSLTEGDFIVLEIDHGTPLELVEAK